MTETQTRTQHVLKIAQTIFEKKKMAEEIQDQIQTLEAELEAELTPVIPRAVTHRSYAPRAISKSKNGRPTNYDRVINFINNSSLPTTRKILTAKLGINSNSLNDIITRAMREKAIKKEKRGQYVSR